MKQTSEHINKRKRFGADHYNRKGDRMKKDWLPDQLQTSKNLIDIALLLIETNNRKWLPTILELLYEQLQTILDEQCVVK